MRKNWYVEDGTAWYQPPGGGSRARGIWRTCETCGEAFPALKTNPGRFCSKKCIGAAIGGSNRATRDDLFLQWTPEECYLAGLLWTDGTLSMEGRRPAGRLMLAMTDEETVAAAATIAGCRYTVRDRREPRKPIYKMQIGDRDAVTRIAVRGMNEPKMQSRPWPDLPHPASFLRGAFDGDGCVYTAYHRYKKNGRQYVNRSLTLRTQLFGSVPFLDGLNRFLATQGISPKTIHVQPKTLSVIHLIEWAKQDSLRLAEVMYSEPGPYLSRKRDGFAVMAGEVDHRYHPPIAMPMCTRP